MFSSRNQKNVNTFWIKINFVLSGAMGPHCMLSCLSAQDFKTNYGTTHKFALKYGDQAENMYTNKISQNVCLSQRYSFC